MNTEQIQLNYQWMIILLLAGLILAAIASSTWAGADIQPTNMGQSWSRLKVVKGSKPGGAGDGVSFKGCESELSPEFHLRVVKGTKIGTNGSGDGGNFAGCS